MRYALFIAAVLASAHTAGAQESASTVTQTFNNRQTIRQTVSSPPGPTLQDLTDANAEAVPGISQTGENLANVISSDLDFSAVTQYFDGEQSIENSIILGAVGALGAIEQSGTNTAGMATGNTIDLATQYFGRNAVQSVNNYTEVATTLESLSQSGSNTANFATADYAIGTGIQNIEEGAVQRVENTLVLSAGAAIAQFVDQRGENFGNILVADRIDNVVRTFAGEQLVLNTVYLGDGSVPEINQSGNNVANLIIANEIGAIDQISIGTQIVDNRVYDQNGKLVTGPGIHQSESNYQGPSSVVNMAVIGSDSSSGSNGDMSISQDADFPQESSGSSGGTQTGNVVVINR